jgi:hypothetical protein
MSTADRPNDAPKSDYTINVDTDQLELLCLGIDALAAGAGDRGASDRMGDFYDAMVKDGTQEGLIARCRSLFDIIAAAGDGKA